MESLLRTVRKKKGLSVSQLAQLSKVPERTIYRLELGKNAGNIKTYEKLASALGVSVSDLYKETEELKDQTIRTHGIVKTRGGGRQENKNNSENEAIELVEEVLSAKFPQVTLPSKIKQELIKLASEQLEITKEQLEKIISLFIEILKN